MEIPPLKNFDFKKRSLQILLISAGVLFILILILRYSVLVSALGNFFDSYLALIGRISNGVLNSLHSKYSILENVVYQESDVATTIDKHYLLLKRSFVIIGICWVTPSKFIYKLAFTGVVIILNALGSIINIVLAVHFIAYFTDVDSIRYVGRLPFELMLLGSFLYWIRKNRINLLTSRLARKYNLDFLVNNFRKISTALFIYIMVSNILLGFFKYTIWINLLFGISAWILNLLGYPAGVESQLLVGEHYSILMARGCLGFNTMLLFTLLIYLTGNTSRTMWLFILVGLVTLNIANIARFVLLFIHLQNQGQYNMSMDLHDMYNYIIYGIVFVLWILWFEKYSYIKKERGSPG